MKILKAGVMILKIQLATTGINYTLKYIQIENNYFKLWINFNKHYFFCIDKCSIGEHLETSL